MALWSQALMLRPIPEEDADMDIDQIELDDVSVLAFLSTSPEMNCVGEVYSPPRVVPYC